MSAIKRLTDALNAGRVYDSQHEATIVRTDDLAAVLAVVEAARAYRAAWDNYDDNDADTEDVDADVEQTFAALAAALARCES